MSMAMAVILILLVVWIFAMARKFYGRMEWDEPADPSPDLQGMHKRQAELQHIQEVLEQAAAEGKLSKALIEEYNRFCDREIETLQAQEKAWKNRPRAGTGENPGAN